MQLFPTQLLAAVQPGAYSLVDVSALVNAQRGKSPRTLVILGDALGGQPNTPLELTSVRMAKTTLRGGKLLDVVRCAFQAVGSLTVVRVGTGIAQGTSGANIKGATAG